MAHNKQHATTVQSSRKLYYDDYICSRRKQFLHQDIVLVFAWPMYMMDKYTGVPTLNF